MSRNKITVTLDGELIEELDLISRKNGTSRSRLVEEAIQSWRRMRRQQELIEGYRAMAPEDQVTAEANLAAAYEILK